MPKANALVIKPHEGLPSDSDAPVNQGNGTARVLPSIAWSIKNENSPDSCRLIENIVYINEKIVLLHIGLPPACLATILSNHRNIKSMQKNPNKRWAEIIRESKGPFSFLALVILCFQAVILALVYKGSQDNINTLVLVSSVIVAIPVLTVSAMLIISVVGRPSKGHAEDLNPIESRKIRIFITSPMSTYGEEQEYASARDEIMEVVTLLRSSTFVDDVYYFNERFKSLSSFENADLSVPEYFSNIDACDYFVLIVKDRQFSSIHYESGYALAKGKQSIYFVQSSNCLPFLTKLAVFAYPHLIRSYEFSSYQEIGKVLSNTEAYSQQA